MLKRLLMILVCLSALAIPARAADIFVAQNSSGANDGTTCANARASTSLAAGDWTSTPRIRVCGAISVAANTTVFSVGGNNVTILFEPNAVLTSPAWAYFNTGFPAGAIKCNGHTGLTIDGGTNGVIQATANGVGLAFNQNTVAIDGSANGNGSGNGCSGLTVQNVHFSNLYVAIEGSASGAINTQIAVFMGGSNSKAVHNTFDHTRFSVYFSYCGITNVESAFNTMTFVENGTLVGDPSPGCSVSGVKIHDNDWGGGAYLWDNAGDNFHHEAIHLEVNNATSSMTNVKVYNNFLHGVWSHGSRNTAGFFLECIGDGAQVFNNIINWTEATSQGDDGFIYLKSCATAGLNSAHVIIVNNTLVGGNTGGKCSEISSTGNIWKNNICMAEDFSVYTPNGENTTTLTANHNDYFQVNNWGIFDSFAGWQSHGLDPQGVVANPLLSGAFIPQTGSGAIGRGENLTALGIPELLVDKAGNSRPGGGNWDAGAYQSGGAPPPPPPTPAPPPVWFSLMVIRSRF